MNKSFGIVALGVGVVILSQACGSSPEKKKLPPSQYDAGGDSSSSGTRSASAGDGSGDGGTTGVTDGGTTGAMDGGTTGSGTAGETSNAGAGGSTDPGDGCEAGMAECDGDPLIMCETPLNLPTSCGGCDSTCKSTNANVICDPVELECKIIDCVSGFGSCDGNAANGCETPLASNASHCGACGRNCAAVGSTCAVDRCDKIPLQQNLPPLGARSWTFGATDAFHMGAYDYVVRRLPFDGATPATVWDPVTKTGGAESLLVTATDVIWAERGSGPFLSAVWTKPIAAAAATLPVILFTPEYQPTYLRIQGNAFYWMSGDYQSGDPGGYVYSRSRTALDDEPGTRIVTVNQGNHGAVLEFMTTSNALYWVTNSATNGAAYELRTTPLAGGTPVAVPPVVGGGTVTAVSSYYGVPVLQAIGDTIYFNRNVDTDPKNGIYRFKTGDTKPTVVALAEDVNTMLVDDTHVYYASQNIVGIFKAPLTGGAGVQIADGNWTRIVGLDTKFVYAFGYGENTVFKIIK